MHWNNFKIVPSPRILLTKIVMKRNGLNLFLDSNDQLHITIDRLCSYACTSNQHTNNYDIHKLYTFTYLIQMIKLYSTYANTIYISLMHYLCSTAYICKSNLYIQSPESYNYTSIQPVTVIYVNLFKYYVIFLKLHYIIFHKKLYAYPRHCVTINLPHSKPSDLFTHIEYSHRVRKVSLSLHIENNNYCYQIEYQWFGIRLIQRSILMNLYEVYAAYIIISKVNNSSMKCVNIHRYFNETILSYSTCSMNILNFNKCTMNYIYTYCFLCQPCHLKFSMACNVCIFVLLGYVQIHYLIITYYHFPHRHIYYPKGNSYFSVYCINYVYIIDLLLMCSGINDNCNIYWSDWFIDCKHKIYSDIYLSINSNFTVLFEINYGHKLSIHLLYQVHIMEMFLVKSDVTVTKFLYLCMHQSKSSTSSFIETRKYSYRHHVMSDFTYNVSYSAVFIFIFKNIQCYRGAENQYYFYRLTYYPVR